VCSAQLFSGQRTTSQQGIRHPITGVNMQYMQDSFDAGNVVAACLIPMTLGQLEPMLRRLLAGRQLFVKQANGSYRAKGSQLGLTRSFEFADLDSPALRVAGT
jgi:hypothetical protein